MLFVEFFAWWYSRGLIELFRRSLNLLSSIWAKFSVGVLLKTLFEPWKRIITEPGGSIQDRSRALLDNIVSRAVGFTIRIFSITAALIVEVLIAMLAIVALLLWPLAPIMVPLAIILGIAS